MATPWTDIPDSSLEPRKPVRSIDMIALRDNPVAIAEGHPDAPRVEVAALRPATGGDSFTLCRILSTPRQTDFASYLDGSDFLLLDPTCHIVVRVIGHGIVRCRLSHRKTHSASSMTAYARVLKNGVQVQEWSISGAGGTGWFERAVDVPVAPGDALTFQQRVTGAIGSEGAQWTGLFISSGNNSLGLA